MEEIILKKLKSFKDIKPDADFLARSRKLIFAAPKNPALEALIPGSAGRSRRFAMSIRESFVLGIAMTLAALLFFMLIGGLSFDGAKNVVAKCEQPPFTIEIGEAKYAGAAKQEVAVALTKLEDEILRLDLGPERSRLINTVTTLKDLVK